jgi:hypothetical protein
VTFGGFQAWLESLYVRHMNTRLILIVFSVLGAVAAVVACVQGLWVDAVFLYSLTTVGLVLLLRRAIGRIRATIHQPKQRAAAEPTPDIAGPTDVLMSQAHDARDQRDRSRAVPGAPG